MQGNTRELLGLLLQAESEAAAPESRRSSADSTGPPESPFQRTREELCAEDAFAKTLGVIFKWLRKGRGVLIDDFAKDVGVSRQAMHGVEAGAWPKLSTLLGIARAFGISPWWLTNPLYLTLDAEGRRTVDEVLVAVWERQARTRRRPGEADSTDG